MNRGASFISPAAASPAKSGLRFFTSIRWEFLLLTRYRVVAVSLIIAGLYAGLFFTLNLHYNDLVILCVISDPVMMGFMFTGVLILYDKNQNTLGVLNITPANPGVKLAARAAALTLLALLCSFAIALAGRGLTFHYALFAVAVILSSFLFYYIGILCLAGVASFNGFLMRSVVYLFPFFIPFLELFDLYSHPLFYLIPTKAVLVLFQASFESASLFDLIYAFIYLSVLTVSAGVVASRKYEKGEI